ncbi:Formate-dependent nitrite reductase cytochrome c552 subunit [Ignavibacterium album JCM 16511]|uniref:nitrite reductase (cytochrome; ammonia-forming) n=1 Tax=Ignavibacterium album (strain DSM 19864 / JCM 16511 / NBRC 101810 / Mat9-16) TaxID=945713 RepID=I0AHW6_IGNAJ|nr:ammonia-forming cytochrome c nitrite reductase [Ignavibacterium album]AFH48573.1 Formate-dependent nitrite reductase cytochrome c552 subunit [Ignavibacterium album JCM 16511]
MKPISDIIKDKPWLGWILFLGTAVVVFLLGLLASSIIERRTESVYTLQMLKPIAEWEPRNEVWGENFPREYESYLKTLNMDFASKHGGSKMIDYLEKYPELVVLWAGYAFSKDYNQGRGHAYAVEDVRNTLRTGDNVNSPMPATCWTCKSTDVPRMMNQMGTANFYKAKWKDLGAEIVNPIGCQDCHDPKTMNLRITRPALIEAFQRQGKDINSFSRQEMRSLVCAQCHVEYYFKGEGKYLTFPWDKGFSADSMEAYFDAIEFSDWTHALSKAPMLKAQHPDYELYKTGIHAIRGVSCADCHMPYKSEGGVKFTDHHIQSPLNNVANTCQVCHREETQRLIQDVYDRQDRVEELRRIAEKTIAAAHIEAKIAWDNGATQEQMKNILKLIRHAQWRWDWVAAANGLGFHAPVEALRVLGTAIQKGEQARRELAALFVKQGWKYPVELPDISTKDKAQKFIGLDMPKLIEAKKEFLNTTAKQWDEEARKRQGYLFEYKLKE